MKGQVKSGGLDAYFEDAKLFDGERVAAAARSKRRAHIFAGIAAGVAALEALAIFAMVPLQRIETKVFSVDRNSGEVQLVHPPVGPQTYSEAVTKAAAVNYVQTREGYLPGQAAHNFRVVLLMSDPAEQRRYDAVVGKDNTQAPQHKLGRTGTMRVDVRSATFPGPNLVMVRFQKVLEQGNEKKVTNWVATLTYAYVEAPSEEKDRYLNPLGFQVSDYRLDPEVL